MSTAPSSSTSQSNFVSIFNATLESYKRKTKKDLASHPLLPSLQSCNSPEAVLTVFREQVPTFSQCQNRDDGLTKWVTPTVNVLCLFSQTIGHRVGLAFPPASIIFAGIDVLLSAAKDASVVQDKLIGIFNRIEQFFHRVEIYTNITPTTGMTSVIVQIMVEVLTILGIATKGLKSGRLRKYLKLTGNRDIEDSLDKLDKLTQEEARMASAEQLKMTQSVDGKVTGVDDRVKGVGEKVQDVRCDVQDVRCNVQDVRCNIQDVQCDVQEILCNVQDARCDVQDVGDRVQTVEGRVQEVRVDVQDVGDKVQDVDDRVQDIDDKLDQANRLSSH